MGEAEPEERWGGSGWSDDFDGPWEAGLSCPQCGALVPNNELKARLHQQWHDAMDEYLDQ